MHYALKLFFAFSLAALAVDVANPGFYASLISGDNIGWVEHKEPKPVNLKAAKITAPAKAEEISKPVESEPLSPINLQIQPVQAPPQAHEPELVINHELPYNEAGPLWSNSYEITNYSTESYEIAQKHDVKELRNKTEQLRREYHRAMKTSGNRKRTELTYERYRTYSDALKIKNSF